MDLDKKITRWEYVETLIFHAQRAGFNKPPVVPLTLCSWPIGSPILWICKRQPNTTTAALWNTRSPPTGLGTVCLVLAKRRPRGLYLHSRKPLVTLRLCWVWPCAHHYRVVSISSAEIQCLQREITPLAAHGSYATELKLMTDIKHQTIQIHGPRKIRWTTPSLSLRVTFYVFRDPRWLNI